ncbi:M42 family metallopeptidase [bacterium]|nr:M42 family metallopeptidase [bacterium]
MNKDILAYLEKLLNAPSPSGYEEPARKLWRAAMAPLAERVHGDTHGNSIAVLNSKGAPRVMLAGHIDEIGFQVCYINDDGYIAFKPIGGFDEGIVPGRRVVIHTAGGPVHGVIGKKAVHLMKEDDRKKPSRISDLWIDIGVSSGKKAKKLVEIADPITYADTFLHLRGGRYVARGVDDRGGAFAVGEVLRYLQGRRLRAAVYSVATVQEEIGLRGAVTSTYGIAPDVGIAVDVTFAQGPENDKKNIGEIALGKGPVVSRGPNFNPKLFDLIVSVAKQRKIPVQIEAAPRGTGTDANAIQLSRAGVAAALVSIPLRYMHTTVEMFDMDDVANVVKLIGETILALDGKADFVL